MSRAWMPFYPADYLADTGHLSTVEHGAYLLLILHYWQRGSLPADDRQLARIARLPAEDWLEIRPTITEFFGPDWRHKRIDQELATAEDRYQRRAEAGRKGGRSGVKAPELPLEGGSIAQAMLNQPQPQPHSHSDLRSEHENPTTAESTTLPAQGRGGGGVSLETRLREAAGLVGATASALRKTGPIEALIAEGLSLEGVILPALRAAAAEGSCQHARSWSYFLDPIRRWTGPALSASPASRIVSVWVLQDSPEGRAWETYLRARGDPVRWLPGRQGVGYGLPSRWPPDHPNHEPASGSPVAA